MEGYMSRFSLKPDISPECPVHIIGEFPCRGSSAYYFTIEFALARIIAFAMALSGVDITETSWWITAQESVKTDAALDPDNIWITLDESYTEATERTCALVKVISGRNAELTCLGWHSHSPGVLLARGPVFMRTQQQLEEHIVNRFMDAGIEVRLIIQKLGQIYDVIDALFYLSIVEWSALPWIPTNDLWPVIFHYIPIQDVIDSRIYLVNKRSNEMFWARYMEPYANRSKVWEVPRGVINMEPGFREVEYSIWGDSVDGVSATLAVADHCGFPTRARYGDIFHFRDIGDYRNEGKYILDRDGCLRDLYHEADEYGSVPDWVTIDEFPSVCYFTDSIAHNNIVWVQIDNYAIVERITLITVPDEVLLKMRNKVDGHILFLSVPPDFDCESSDSEMFHALPHLMDRFLISQSVCDEVIKHGATVDNFAVYDIDLWY